MPTQYDLILSKSVGYAYRVKSEKQTIRIVFLKQDICCPLSHILLQIEINSVDISQNERYMLIIITFFSFQIALARNAI